MASYVVKQPASAVSFVVLEILLGSNWQEHPGLVAPKPSQNKGSCMRGDKVGSYWVRVSIWLHCTWFFFFFRDWVSVSCFTGQLPGIGTVFILASLQMCKVQRQSPLASQGGWGGRRLESAGSGGSCARRSLRVGGSPSRL